MAAPSTALEWCVVPLPSCPASGCGWTDSHPTITGGWFGSWRQGPDQLMERWVLLLPPFPAKMEVAASLPRQDGGGYPRLRHPPFPHLNRSSTEARKLHRGYTTSQRRTPWPPAESTVERSGWGRRHVVFPPRSSPWDGGSLHGPGAVRGASAHHHGRPLHTPPPILDALLYTDQEEQGSPGEGRRPGDS